MEFERNAKLNKRDSKLKQRFTGYLITSGGLHIDLFILKNMGAAIIDFRVCPPLVKCQNLMFSGFIVALMYGFSSTGVTIYCYFGLKFIDNTCCEVIFKRRYNDNDMTTNKLPGMYFFFKLPLYSPYKISINPT